MSRIEESISKLKRFKYHAIGRLELEDAIDNVVSWYEQMMKWLVETDGEVCKLADRVWITPTDEKRFHQDVFDNFKSGDKVRIIILPKEDGKCCL